MKRKMDRIKWVRDVRELQPEIVEDRYVAEYKEYTLAMIATYNSKDFSMDFEAYVAENADDENRLNLVYLYKRRFAGFVEGLLDKALQVTRTQVRELERIAKELDMR